MGAETLENNKEKSEVSSLAVIVIIVLFQLIFVSTTGVVAYNYIDYRFFSDSAAEASDGVDLQEVVHTEEIEYIDVDAENEDNSTDLYITNKGQVEEKTKVEVASLKKSIIQIRSNYNLGSGIIINKEGYILTNRHVVDRISDYYAVFEDENGFLGKELPLEILAFDGNLDLALLKIKSEEILNYEPIPIVSMENVQVGQDAVAIGSPQGLINTVSFGSISSIRKAEGVTIIQTDAAVSQGNSGGALLNMKGELVGIITSKLMTGENLNFAISSDDIIRFLDKIKNSPVTM